MRNILGSPQRALFLCTGTKCISCVIADAEVRPLVAQGCSLLILAGPHWCIP